MSISLRLSSILSSTSWAKPLVSCGPHCCKCTLKIWQQFCPISLLVTYREIAFLIPGHQNDLYRRFKVCTNLQYPANLLLRHWALLVNCRVHTTSHSYKSTHPQLTASREWALPIHLSTPLCNESRGSPQSLIFHLESTLGHHCSPAMALVRIRNLLQSPCLFSCQGSRSRASARKFFFPSTWCSMKWIFEKNSFHLTCLASSLLGMWRASILSS